MITSVKEMMRKSNAQKGKLNRYKSGQNEDPRKDNQLDDKQEGKLTF